MPAKTAKPITHRAMLAIALPVMLSTLTTPLIGVVDTAAVGQLPEAYHIGAVAIGALIFDFVFWAFGFLRMGTSGFVAQAEGAGDDQLLRDTLGRALMVALVCGLAIIVLQPLIKVVAFYLIDGSAEVERAAATYFDIRVWSAPAALANYAFYGFFIGIGRARSVLMFVLVVNGLNVVLDLVFVLGFGMAAAGVALGTLIAEYAGAAAALVLVASQMRHRGGRWDMSRFTERPRLARMMSVNGDILVRSVLLVCAFSWFTAQSAHAGDLILAANTVLMNMFMITSNLLDGFAFAAETHVGQAVGAANRERFRQAVKLSSLWALIIAGVASLGFAVFGGAGIDAMSVNPQVRETARVYLMWAALAPLVGCACFQLDGIFIGATQTRDMRNMMLISLVIYIAAWFVLVPAFDNHGRWMSLMVLYVVRAVTLGARLPALERQVFAARA